MSRASRSAMQHALDCFEAVALILLFCFAVTVFGKVADLVFGEMAAPAPAQTPCLDTPPPAEAQP